MKKYNISLLFCLFVLSLISSSCGSDSDASPTSVLEVFGECQNWDSLYPDAPWWPGPRNGSREWVVEFVYSTLSGKNRAVLWDRESKSPLKYNCRNYLEGNLEVLRKDGDLFAPLGFRFDPAQVITVSDTGDYLTKYVVVVEKIQ